MKKLHKIFLYPFCICIFSNFEKIFLKSTQNFNILYWSWINFIIMNAKFSQECSKFLPNIPKFYSEFISSFLWISFEIYLKSIQYFLKIFVTFIPENFPEICTNFSKNFLKNLIELLIKFYSRIAQILHIVYPKFPDNSLVFVDFPQISITIISSHLNIFTIN